MSPNDKLLDKLSKLKKMAEGAAAIGSEAEAQAFADKLQAMLLDHDLQMSDIDFEKLAVEEPIEDEYVDVSKHGVKHVKSRVAWMERLAGMVARANFCRILIVPNSNNFYIVGRREHRAVAEYMIVTLMRAVQDISKKEHAKFSWECYKRDKSTYAARGFKESFITAFLVRLFERLEELKRTASDSTSTALVRINREDAAVEKNLADRREAGMFGPKRKGLMLSRGNNYEGATRGRAAADKVSLAGKAVGSNPTNKGQLS